MRAIVGTCVAALLLGPGLAACGGSDDGYLSTPSVRSALREAGFSNLQVFSQRRAAEQLERRLGQAGKDLLAIKLPRYDLNDVLDEDTIWAPPIHRGWPTLIAARLPSSAMAKESFERGYKSKAISQQIAEARTSGDLPTGFARDKLRAARVCNVILWSYNADRKPRVTASFHRAVRLLRSKC